MTIENQGLRPDASPTVEQPLSGSHAPSRRALVAATAWAVPVVVVGTSTPAWAVSATDTMTLAVRPSQIPSGQPGEVIARVRDAQGNPAAGRAVTLTLDPAGIALDQTSLVTDTFGMCSTTFTVPGDFSGASATVTAVSGALTAAASFTAYAVNSGDTVTVRLQPNTLNAGETATAVVQVRSRSGAPVAWRPVSLSVQGVTGATLERLSGSTDSSGTFSTVLAIRADARGPLAGTVSASSAGLTSSASFSVRSAAIIQHSSDGLSTAVTARAFGDQGAVRDLENRYMSHSDWQPTARYARKGDVIVVTVEAGAPALTLGIGYLGPVASQNGGSDVGIAGFGLASGQTTRITADRDGVVFVRNTSMTVAASLTLTGGLAQPVWVRGRTTDADFSQQMSAFSAAPFVTFVSTWVFADVQRRVVTSTSYSPSDHVDRLDDVFLRTATVYGLDPRAVGIGRKLPGTAYITGPDSGSGYANASNGRLCFQVNTGASRDLLAGSGWGHWHETGHTFQTTQYTWGNLVEVTVNISSLAVQEGWGQGNRLDESGNQSMVKTFFAKPVASRNFDDARAVSPFLPLFLFDQLRRAFGPGFYPRVSQMYRISRFVGEWQPGSDQEKRDVFATTTSRVANRNLAPFFEQWGVILTQGVKDQLAAYPALATQPWTSTTSGSTKLERTISYDLPVGAVSGPASVPLGATSSSSVTVTGLQTLGGASAAVVRTGVRAATLGSGSGWIYAICQAADGTQEVIYRSVDVTVVSGIRFTGLGDQLVGWISLVPETGVFAATSTGRQSHWYFSGQVYYSITLRDANGTEIVSASVDGGADGSAVANALNGRAYKNGYRLTIFSREPSRTIRFANGSAVGGLPASTHTYTISNNRLT